MIVTQKGVGSMMNILTPRKQMVTQGGQSYSLLKKWGGM